MAKLFIEETSLIAIGDAIREKTGSTATMSPAEMITAIENIVTTGGETVIGDIGIVGLTYKTTSNLVNTYDVSDYNTKHCFVITRTDYSGGSRYITEVEDGVTKQYYSIGGSDGRLYEYNDSNTSTASPNYCPTVTIDEAGIMTVTSKSYKLGYYTILFYSTGSGEAGGGITPEGELAITENGSYDVTEYASAAVNVPVGITPTGTFDITDNGIFDISQYESVNVNIATSGSGDTFQQYMGGKDSSYYYVTLDSNTMGSTYTREGAFAYDTGLRTLTANGVTRFSINTCYNCSNLVEVYAPNLLVVDNYVLQNTPYLQVIDMPEVFQFGQSVLYGANAYGTTATKWSFPKLETMGMYSFRQANVATLDFGALLEIANYAFYYAANIKNVIIRTNSVCTLGGSSAFANSGISKGTGYVYVPAALVDNYKAANNWSQYAAQIRAIEDYPEICG